MKKLPKSQIEFDLEISPEEVSEYLKKAAEELSKEVEIKGFRKGKAPQDVLEKTIGKQAIFEEAGKFAIEKRYETFIKENKVVPIDYPRVDVKKMAEGNPILVNVVVTVYPEIKLADYKKIAKEFSKNRKKDVKVEEKELEESLSYIRNSRATEIAVKREVKEGDIAEVNFETRVDGVKIEGGESKNHPVKVGDKKFIPGFEENLVGLKAGDKKEFKLKAPADYFKKDLAGKDMEFKVTVNNVLDRVLPELDDEFAKSLGQFKTIEELKNNVKEGMQKEKEEKEKSEFRNSLVEKIAKETKMDLPDVLLDRELEKMVHEMKANIEQHGLDFQTYLLSIKKSEDDLRDDMKPQAEIRIKAAMVIEEIAKGEEIEVEEEMITKKANEVLHKYKSIDATQKDINPEQLKSYSKMVLINEKVLDLLENIK